MVKPTLTLEFDEAVSAGASDNLIIVKSLATDVVNVALPQDLAHSTKYYVTIGTGTFVDRVGNSFGGFGNNTHWRFTTANPNLITSR